MNVTNVFAQPGEFELIGTMPAGNTSFSDFSAPNGHVYYMVEIALDAPCTLGKNLSSIKSNIATNAPQSISENTAENIKIYPNPTSGEFQIESKDLRVENIDIFDVYGRNVGVNTEVRHENSENGILLNISHLSAGVYFLKINTEIGQLIRKVLKE
jgi:hypothetical protein